MSSGQGSIKKTDTAKVVKRVVYAPAHITVAQLLSRPLQQLVSLNQTFLVKGHVRSHQLQFVHLYDGSTSQTLQLVLDQAQQSAAIAKYGPLYRATTISALVTIKPSFGKAQLYDGHVVGDSFTVLGSVAQPATFLPSLKGISMEKWRANTHLRSHSAVQGAIFRIRSVLSRATHRFMEIKGVAHLDPNEITRADCEGAGEMFACTTMLENGRSHIPVIGKTDTIDCTKDHFENEQLARLTVSSQLGLEYLVPGMGAVYTSNKSFRAEKSQTKRHLAEFTHIEAELPFISFDELLDFEEEYVIYCLTQVLREVDDLKLLDSFYSKGVVEKLLGFVACSPWPRVTYEEALKILMKQKEKVLKWSNEIKDIPKFGEDLGGVCERYLTEQVFHSPIFVINMPAQLKSFYMKRNADGVTVAGGDLLLPGLGELIGASIRENDYCKLVNVMMERKMHHQSDQSDRSDLKSNIAATATTATIATIATSAAVATPAPCVDAKSSVDAKTSVDVKSSMSYVKSTVDEKSSTVQTVSKECMTAPQLHKQLIDKGISFGPLDPYVGLRLNASTPTGGFGLGFERLITVCTTNLTGGNIREASVFPVAYRELDM